MSKGRLWTSGWVGPVCRAVYGIRRTSSPNLSFLKHLGPDASSAPGRFLSSNQRVVSFNLRKDDFRYGKRMPRRVKDFSRVARD